MALKKTTKDFIAEKKESTLEELEAKLQHLYEESQRIEKEKADLRNHIRAIRLSPFRVGDVVLYTVSQGRTQKETKCVIEIEDGSVYVRPYKNDGTLSGRHFGVYTDKYAEVFKRCE